MRNACFLIACITALAAPAGTVRADPLPEGARPLAARSLVKLYSGTTLDRETSMAYFAPDLTVKGVSGKNLKGAVWVGTWQAKGNEVCMDVQWRDLATGKTGPSRDCWKWYVAPDKTIWTLWSVHYDGTRPDPDGDYYDGELAKMKRGDLVSDRYARLTGQ